MNALKNFPHIIESIKLMWGDREISKFFRKITVMDREGERQGFPPEAMSEILLLWRCHEMLYGAEPETPAFTFC